MRGSQETSHRREVDTYTRRAHEGRDRLDRFYEGQDGRVVSGLRIAGNLVTSLATGQFGGSPELGAAREDFRRAGEAKRAYRDRVSRAEGNLPPNERRRVKRELASRAVRSAIGRTF